MLVDEAAIEGPLDQNFEFAQTEHRDGTLPALPDKGSRLRTQFHERVSEKSAHQIPIEFPSQHQHGERFAHSGPDKLVGFRVQNDLIERFHKVLNEPDFLPLHFVRVLVQGTKLVRTHRGTLVPTRLGKAILVSGRHGALQALLFHIALWHLNLGYFDRNPIDSWPQSHTSIVLWSLSASANNWLDRETLTRLCTVPVVGVLEATWDLGSFAMESRILRPLMWFGLLESRSEGKAGPSERRLYRKTALFDRFLKFNVQIERPTTRH
jgi:hypothetical protein